MRSGAFGPTSTANPKAIQQFMGHSKIRMTFDVYGTYCPAVTTRSVSGWTAACVGTMTPEGVSGSSATITDVDQPHVKLTGDIEGPYVVEEARSDGRLVLTPDTSAQAIMERLGHEPAALAEFEAVHGAVKPADGEG